MSSGRRIVDLWAEFQAMPERQLFEKIRTFQYSLTIFEGNYRELRKILLWQANDPEAKQLWYLPNQHLLHTFLKEVARLLHNYVAAAQSLLDHTRRHHQALYEDSRLFPEYNDEVNRRFATNRLATFVKGLRQYCQHYEFPPVASVLSPSAGEPGYSSRISLDSDKLREFSGWKAPAKEFLKDAGDTIDLLEVIDDHHKMVVDFHRWLESRQREIHARDFQRVAEKQREIESLDIRDTLRSVLASFPDGPWDPDDYFRYILSPAQWAELNSYPPDSLERCDRLIAFIQTRADIGDDLKSQIRSLYGVE